MKIDKIHLNNLRNNEHFQYMTDFAAYVAAAGVERLNAQKQYDALVATLDMEEDAFNRTIKSLLTKEIVEADTARDTVFRGLWRANTSALHHFNSEIAEAATRMQVVFDAHGDATRKAVVEKTSVLSSLLETLMEKYAEDMITVGLDKWAKELHSRNEEVKDLLLERDTEHTGRSDMSMKEARVLVNKAYLAVVDRIHSMHNIEGDEEGAPYADFINHLNVTIARYNNLIAQRRGRYNAAKEKEAAAVVATVQNKQTAEGEEQDDSTNYTSAENIETETITDR